MHINRTTNDGSIGARLSLLDTLGGNVMFNLNDRQMNNELERRRDEEHCGSTNDYGQFNEYYDDYCPEDECVDDYTEEELAEIPASIIARMQPSKKAITMEDIFNADYDDIDYKHAEMMFGLTKKDINLMLSVDLSKEESATTKETIKGDVEMTTTIERVPYKVVGTVIGKNDRVLGTKEFWTTTSDGTKAIENIRKRVRRSGLLLADPQYWRDPAKETIEEVADQIAMNIKPQVVIRGWQGGIGLGKAPVTVRGNTREVRITRVDKDGTIVGFVGKAWFKLGRGEMLPCVKINYKAVPKEVRVLVMEFISQCLLDVQNK